MKINFTDEALANLEDRLLFLIKVQKVPLDKVEEIRANLFSSTKILLDHPNIGQIEENFSHLKLNHRRLIEGHYKIIYRVDSGIIHVTDFFDTREHPSKMRA